MSICLFPNTAYLSETSRAIAIYRALREEGESPFVATHGGTYEFVLQKEHIPYHIVPPVMTPERCRDYVLANNGKKPRFYSTQELREHVNAEVYFFREHMIRVVHIGFTLSAKLSARVEGIPLSTTHGSFFPLVFEKRLAPYRKDFNRGPVRLLPESWKVRFVNWLYSHGRFYTGPFNAVARESGIPPIRSVVDLFSGDYTFVTDTPEIIGISTEEMEAWENAADSRYSSSIRLIHAGAIYAKLFGELPQDVLDFLNTDKPKLFVALTSSAEDYLSAVYDCVKHLDVRVVFCTTTQPKRFKSSEHVLITDHVPSHRIMPMCDLAIIHGGQGSVQTAIASGTPVIGFALQPEQNLNLQLVENHGAGFNLTVSELKRRRLAGYIHSVLSDRRFAVNMNRLREWQARYDGPKNVARGLQEIARSVRCDEHRSPGGNQIGSVATRQ